MSQSQVKDSFLDLERHRQLLETNLEKLRKSLQHWQTWSAEYEGLKEEVQALGDASPADLRHLAETYEGELVTKSEIDDILGAKSPSKTTRNAEQVSNVLDRRIDYVSQNIATVEKQVAAAEDKLEKAAIVGRPEVRNEEGLPLMEIFEELDEDGNVIEGRVEAHGSSTGLLEEVLKKAGVDKAIPETQMPALEATALVREGNKNVSTQADLPKSIMPKKKSVSFSDEPEVPEITQPTDQAIKQAEKEAKRLQAVMERAADLNKPIQDPIIPSNESTEDARLRQEMLQYGMSEIGAVVAELDFEDESDFEDEGYDDRDEETASLEEEDAFGRSTRSVINDDLRAEMRALEEKLGVRMMQNVGSNPKLEPQVLDPKVAPAPHLAKKEAVEPAMTSVLANKDAKTQKTGKKGVRFAQELDVSPAPDAEPQELATANPAATIQARNPVADIVERNPISSPNATKAPEQPKKVSRFKASRTSGPSPTPFIPPNPSFAPTRSREVPSGPTNRTLSDTIVEKPVILGDALEPDMHDPALLQQEVATEYYKKRNLMVQRQGGFKDQELEEEERTGIVPFTEEEGGPKKVSRFMAARLARQ